MSEANYIVPSANSNILSHKGWRIFLLSHRSELFSLIYWRKDKLGHILVWFWLFKCLIKEDIYMHLFQKMSHTLKNRMGWGCNIPWKIGWGWGAFDSWMKQDLKISSYFDEGSYEMWSKPMLRKLLFHWKWIGCSANLVYLWLDVTLRSSRQGFPSTK